MPPRDLYDLAGNVIHLGNHLGGGGEGEVYEIDARDDLVAKIYHQPLSAEQARKLRAMIGMPAGRIVREAAWPQQTLHRSRRGRHRLIVGATMPRIAGCHDLSCVYTPGFR